MTVKLSQQKISRLLKYYFAGVIQPTIARKVDTDQSTISLYAKRFSERAAEIGLLATAKEYNVYKEVSELRNLSVEMQKYNLTTEDAREGVGIIKTFSKLNVPTDQYSKLIKVCSKIDQPKFIEAALNLVRIETGAGISYDDVTSRFEEVTVELPVAESKLKKTKANLRDLNSLVDKRKRR